MKSKINAPKILPQILWSKSIEEFNSWRRVNDFPRILDYFKESMNRFIEWQQLFKIQDKDILEIGLGQFLKPAPMAFLYTYTNKKQKEIGYQELLKDESFHGNIISEILPFIPYLEWARKNRIKIHEKSHNYNISITETSTSNSNSSAYIFGELELLWLGGCSLHV